MRGFRNVWVCEYVWVYVYVGVCTCGFFNLWVFVRVGFLICRCVYL